MLPLFAAGLALLFGLGDREVKKFERIASADILSKLSGEQRKVSISTELNGLIGGPLGDLKKVTIRAKDFSLDELPLYTEPERRKSGRIRMLELNLENFVMRQLRIVQLNATIPNCRYDYDLARKQRQIRLSESGIGQGTVKILQADLEAYILKKFREIKRVKVRIEKGHVFVDGFGEFLVIQSEFSVIAKLTTPDGKKLELTQAKIFFGDLVADEFTKKALLELLNPVVDLEADLGLGDAITIERIEAWNGVLEVSGRTKIPQRSLPYSHGLSDGGCGPAQIGAIS